MANLSNIFAAVLSFAIGAIMVYSFNGGITFIIDLFGSGGGLVKIIISLSWLAMVVLLTVYYPIHVLTSDDKRNIETGNNGRL